MIKVVVGSEDRVLATHPAADAVDVAGYSGAKAKGEKLEVVTVPDDAVVYNVELDREGIPTGRRSVALVAGWREKVVAE